MLSFNFDVKDVRLVDVILEIKIRKKDNGIILTQSYYIEKTLIRKFDHYDCKLVSDHWTLVLGCILTRETVSQLEYVWAIMSTRPDIDFVVGKL